MKKLLTVCDSCKTPILKFSEQYNIKLMSKRFTDAAGQGDNNIKDLDFCGDCAKHIEESLRLISLALKIEIKREK